MLTHRVNWCIYRAEREPVSFNVVSKSHFHRERLKRNEEKREGGERIKDLHTRRWVCSASTCKVRNDPLTMARSDRLLTLISFFSG